MVKTLWIFFDKSDQIVFTIFNIEVEEIKYDTVCIIYIIIYK